MSTNVWPGISGLLSHNGQFVGMVLLIVSRRHIVLSHLCRLIRRGYSRYIVCHLDGGRRVGLKPFLTSIRCRAFSQIIVFSQIGHLIPRLHILGYVPKLVFLRRSTCRGCVPRDGCVNICSQLCNHLPDSHTLISKTIITHQLGTRRVSTIFISGNCSRRVLRGANARHSVPINFLNDLGDARCSRHGTLLRTLSQHAKVLIAQAGSNARCLRVLGHVGVFIDTSVNVGRFVVGGFRTVTYNYILLT